MKKTVFIFLGFSLLLMSCHMQKVTKKQQSSSNAFLDKQMIEPDGERRVIKNRLERLESFLQQRGLFFTAEGQINTKKFDELYSYSQGFFLQHFKAMNFKIEEFKIEVKSYIQIPLQALSAEEWQDIKIYKNKLKSIDKFTSFYNYLFAHGPQDDLYQLYLLRQELALNEWSFDLWNKRFSFSSERLKAQEKTDLPSEKPLSSLTQDLLRDYKTRLEMTYPKVSQPLWRLLLQAEEASLKKYSI